MCRWKWKTKHSYQPLPPEHNWQMTDNLGLNFDKLPPKKSLFCSKNVQRSSEKLWKLIDSDFFHVFFWQFFSCPTQKSLPVLDWENDCFFGREDQRSGLVLAYKLSLSPSDWGSRLEHVHRVFSIKWEDQSANCYDASALSALWLCMRRKALGESRSFRLTIILQIASRDPAR